MDQENWKKSVIKLSIKVLLYLISGFTELAEKIFFTS